ncbi:MAG TPA: trypsin-like serine protease [Polyangiales bacterium]
MRSQCTQYASGLLCVLLELCGCSAEPVDDGVSVVAAADHAALEPSWLDAVGSLRRELLPHGAPQLICSGSLIGQRTVLTAKHCVDQVLTAMAANERVTFGLGPDVQHARRAIAIAGALRAPRNDGGWNGLGHDLAVISLREPIVDVLPLNVARWQTEAPPRALWTAGYGAHDDLNRRGLKRSGPVHLRATNGRIYERIFGNFSSFYRWQTGEPPPAHCQGGADAPCDALARAQRTYEETHLEDASELYAGGLEGDVQPCFGDSGGPLVGLDTHGIAAIYGVLSGGLHSRSQRCDHGAIYARFDDALFRFAQDARRALW